MSVCWRNDMRTALSHFPTEQFPARSACDETWGPDRPRGSELAANAAATSAQASGTLDGLNGHFFSGPDAEEAVIQGDLAKRLVDAGQAPASLLGQEITLRFAQRQALPPPSQQAPTDAPNQAVGPDEEAMGFSIVPSEKKFRVVGVLPASDSGGGPVGFNNAGLYLPLAVAEKLQVVQGADLRRSEEHTSDLQSHLNLVCRLL